MLVLGEGFSRQTGPWLQWVGQVLEDASPGAIEKARTGQPQTVKFKGFSMKVLPASQLNVPEQLAFSTGSMLVSEPDLPRAPELRIAPYLEITPSELAALNGCFRFFELNRISGIPEPGRLESGAESSRMKLGSIAHKFLESAVRPSAGALQAAGVPDLATVFESTDWMELEAALPERELPFVLHMNIGGKDCWIRGRMDAAVAGEVPRVVDYKYALWHENAESDYEMQMTAYALALMKALETGRAFSELWYLKAPMKIVRMEHRREDAEAKLETLLLRYVHSLSGGEWPRAERAYCDHVQCGFRERCWN
jgi:hypothetical protein